MWKNLRKMKTFKYLTGNFKNMQEAFDEQRRLRKVGFKDAFTVAFIDGKKTTIKEAKEFSIEKTNKN